MSLIDLDFFHISTSSRNEKNITLGSIHDVICIILPGMNDFLVCHENFAKCHLSKEYWGRIRRDNDGLHNPWKNCLKLAGESGIGGYTLTFPWVWRWTLIEHPFCLIEILSPWPAIRPGHSWSSKSFCRFLCFSWSKLSKNLLVVCLFFPRFHLWNTTLVWKQVCLFQAKTWRIISFIDFLGRPLWRSSHLVKTNPLPTNPPKKKQDLIKGLLTIGFP